MNRNELKRADCEEINRERGRIFQIGRAILENPELGYKETKTAA